MPSVTSRMLKSVGPHMAPLVVVGQYMIWMSLVPNHKIGVSGSSRMLAYRLIAQVQRPTASVRLVRQRRVNNKAIEQDDVAAAAF